MRTLIVIPCMDTVYTSFMSSLLHLEPVGDVSYKIVSGTLIYDARNQLVQHALQSDCDQVLWLDSDMIFPPDLLKVLTDDLVGGREMVSGLYFTRRQPIRPCVFQECSVIDVGNGQKMPLTANFYAYPQDQIFEIAACGFGAVLMSRKLLEDVTDKFGKMPFSPALGFGEDLSFCMRVSKAGHNIYCDSRVKLGHIARMPIEEKDYLLCQSKRC